MQGYVKRLLKLRNSHCVKPYYCQRFKPEHDTDWDHRQVDKTPSKWTSWDKPTPIQLENGWKCYYSTDKSNSISICPSGQRVTAALDVYYDQEDVCERGDLSIPLERDIAHLMYPMGQLPPDLSTLLTSLQQAREPVQTQALLCKRCGAEDAYSAKKQFDLLQLGLESLLDFEAYPIGLLTRVEAIDGITMVLTPAPSAMQVSSWLDSRRVLVLSGDIATLYAGSETGQCMHVDLLHSVTGYDDTDLPPPLVACQAVQRYKPLLIHMMVLRQTMGQLLHHDTALSIAPIGIFPSAATAPACSMQQYTSQGNRYYVIATSQCSRYRGVFSNRYLLSYTPVLQQLEVLSPAGEMLRLSVPFPLHTVDASLHTCFMKLMAFIRWHESSPEDRQRAQSECREGVSLALHSCLQQTHRDTLKQLAQGEIDASAGLARHQELLQRVNIPAEKPQRVLALVSNFSGVIGGREQDRENIKNMVAEQVSRCSSFLHNAK